MGVCTASLFKEYPVLLCTRPIGFPTNIELFAGIAEIHGFHQGPAFYFNGLGKNQACNNRQNYLIHNIILLSNICYVKKGLDKYENILREQRT